MKKILITVGSLLKPFKSLIEWIAEIECFVASSWVSSAHHRLMMIQWGIPPQPEYFDHRIDLFFQWVQSRNPLWLERGVFGSLALKNGMVLELACGDGFNARNFYSLRSDNVIACDFDPQAIRKAIRKNSAPNVIYKVADIRHDMPSGHYDNIVWDSAIEHFTPDEIQNILKDIKVRLTQDGILSGYTIVEKSGGMKSLSHHEYEFKDKEDLFRFFTPYFAHVIVFETIYPARHNLYFWASDAALPFTREWPQMVSNIDWQKNIY